jgi:hypothetical protein
MRTSMLALVAVIALSACVGELSPPPEQRCEEPPAAQYAAPWGESSYCADVEAGYLAVVERLGCCESFVCMRPIPAGGSASEVVAAFERSETCADLYRLADPWR